MGPLVQHVARRDAELALKREHIAEMLASVKRKERVVTRHGGATITSFADEIAFQQARLDLVEWLQAAEVDAIAARRDSLLAALGEDGPGLLGSDTRGLPVAVVLQVASVELCQLALGEHPAQVARAAQAGTATEGGDA